MEFRFWRRPRGDSPPEKNLAKVRGVEYIKIGNKLDIIQRYGFNAGIRSGFFKPINFYRKETLYQINVDQYRILFVMKEGVGWIYDVFMKKSKSDEQQHYQSVHRRLK